MAAPNIRIRRQSGDGYYEEGDRVIARDLVNGQVERIGTVGQIGTDHAGKKYMVIRHGDEPFVEGFIATARDIVQDLPKDDTVDAIEKWLEEGKSK